MKISRYILTIKDEKFIEQKSMEDISTLIKHYSMAKYGSIKDIKLFANIIVASIFKEIDNLKSDFRRILEVAKKNDDYIVLMTPGYRNVKSSANIMFDIALLYINTKLALMEFPIIAKLKLPRLASPCENYASLTSEERVQVGLTTDHILPDKSFYEYNNVHVLYGDDILITGSSSNKAKKDVLEKGAKSFTSIYAIIVDKYIALNNPSVEEYINRSKVTEKLDKTAIEIFEQNDFIPVLRSLRLLLNKNNKDDLKSFLKKIPLKNILKIYISYIINESLHNKKYISSLDIIKKYLIDKSLIKKDGNLI